MKHCSPGLQGPHPEDEEDPPDDALDEDVPVVDVLVEEDDDALEDDASLDEDVDPEVAPPADDPSHGSGTSNAHPASPRRRSDGAHRRARTVARQAAIVDTVANLRDRAEARDFSPTSCNGRHRVGRESEARRAAAGRALHDGGAVEARLTERDARPMNEGVELRS